MSGTGWDDERGVSEVLGAIMLFGILILAIGLLQSFYVPHELSMTEKDHVEQVTDEFTEMYTAIGDAAGTNKERSASISLGTRYGINSIFLTPPPAGGTVKTEDQGDIKSKKGDQFSGLSGTLVDEVCGLDGVRTKAITHQTRYNEYQDTPTHVYEAGLHYRIINDDVAIANKQRLVTEGESVTTIHLTPITHGSIHESGTTKESITFMPGVTGETARFSGDDSNPVEITVPIKSEAGWKATFEGGIVDTTNTEATLRLDDPSETYRIRCTPIGINEGPDNSPSVEFRADNDDDSGGFNPIGSGSLVLQGSSHSGKLYFENTAESSKTVTDVRIPWLQEPGQNTDEFYLHFEDDDSSIPVETGITSWTETGDWTWEAEGDSGDRKSIDVSSKEKEKKNENENPNTGYAIVFRFDDGTTATYLVSG